MIFIKRSIIHDICDTLIHPKHTKTDTNQVQDSVYDVSEDHGSFLGIISAVIATFICFFFFGFRQESLAVGIVLPLGRVKTFLVHYGWEKVDKEIADKSPNKSHKSGERYFRTQNTEHSRNYHENKSENGEVFVGDFTKDEFEDSSPTNRYVGRKSADNIDEITNFHNENSPLTEITVNKSVFTILSCDSERA